MTALWPPRTPAAASAARASVSDIPPSASPPIFRNSRLLTPSQNGEPPPPRIVSTVHPPRKPQPHRSAPPANVAPCRVLTTRLPNGDMNCTRPLTIRELGPLIPRESLFSTFGVQ